MAGAVLKYRVGVGAVVGAVGAVTYGVGPVVGGALVVGWAVDGW